jgi:hypothetical protein
MLFKRREKRLLLNRARRKDLLNMPRKRLDTLFNRRSNKFRPFAVNPWVIGRAPSFLVPVGCCNGRMKGNMPHELLERVLPERAHSPTGGYEQDCFDSALGFDLHIAVTSESSVVFEE